MDFVEGLPKPLGFDVDRLTTYNYFIGLKQLANTLSSNNIYQSDGVKWVFRRQLCLRETGAFMELILDEVVSFTRNSAKNNNLPATV